MGPARFTLLTPRGKGAIAVVAVAGAGRERAAAWLRTGSGRPVSLADLAVPRLCRLVAGEETIDLVLAVDLPPPLARLELHLHGSEAVLAAFESRIGPLEAPAGSPADRLLQSALDAAQIALALEQKATPLCAFLAALERMPPAEREAAAREALLRSRAAIAQAEPARLVLCGAQNAGKSTLMNRLLWSQRTLVGDEPGLTRDPVEETVVLAGYPYELVDTAGHGDARDELDSRAQARAEHARRGALRLLVVDGSLGPGPSDVALADAKTLWIRGKADLPQAPWPEELLPVVAASCLDPVRAAGLRAEIGAALLELRGLPAAGPVGGPAALTRDEELSLASFVRGVSHG